MRLLRLADRKGISPRREPVTDWSDATDGGKFFTKREFAAKEIRDAIQNGFYQPGEVVREGKRMNLDLLSYSRYLLMRTRRVYF